MLIPGSKLTPSQKQQVLGKFVHWRASGETEEVWLRLYAFEFTKKGTLSRNQHVATRYYGK